MSARVRIQLDPVQKIKIRHHLDKNGKVQKFLTHEVRRKCDPYVPFGKGPLKNSAVEKQNCIEYIQPYSAENYYNNAGNRTQGMAHGGMRGKLWDKRMMADQGNELVKAVANYAGGRAGKK